MVCWVFSSDMAQPGGNSAGPKPVTPGQWAFPLLHKGDLDLLLKCNRKRKCYLRFIKQ